MTGSVFVHLLRFMQLPVKAATLSRECNLGTREEDTSQAYIDLILLVRRSTCPTMHETWKSTVGISTRGHGHELGVCARWKQPERDLILHHGTLCSCRRTART